MSVAGYHEWLEGNPTSILKLFGLQPHLNGFVHWKVYITCLSCQFCDVLVGRTSGKLQGHHSTGLDGGRWFLWRIGVFLSNYMTSHPTGKSIWIISFCLNILPKIHIYSEISLLTFTSSFFTTESPAKGLEAVTFIVIWPSFFGVIMKDTEDPLLALTDTLFRRYNSSSGAKTRIIIKKETSSHLQTNCCIS